MAYCKICDCGEVIRFEKKSSYPSNCPVCSRQLWTFKTYQDDDPVVLARLGNSSQEEKTELSSDQPGSPLQTDAPAADHFMSLDEKEYYLEFGDGSILEIPAEGGMIGRTGLGAEILENYPSVSREHLEVVPTETRGLMITDVSTYGTKVDGIELKKNDSVFVSPVSRITLCNVDVLLKERSVK